MIDESKNVAWVCGTCKDSRYGGCNDPPPPDRRPKVGVGVFVLRGNSLLLGRRIGSHGADTWSIPGGLIEADEMPAQAGARELWEEAGISVITRRTSGNKDKPLLRELYNTPATLRFFDKPGGPQGYVTLYTLVVVPAETEAVVREPTKCVEWRWVTLGGLEWPGTLFACLQDFLDAVHVVSPYELGLWLKRQP